MAATIVNLIFTTLAILVSLTTAANSGYGIFSTPPDAGPAGYYTNNEVYQLGSTIQLAWDTSMPEYRVTLWQQSLNITGAYSSEVDILTKPSIGVESGGISWVVQTYEFNLVNSPVFFLAITHKGLLSRGFTCHYFNISQYPVEKESQSSSPTGAALLSPTSSPSPSSSPYKPEPSSGSENSNSNTNENTQNSTATNLALGIGIGLGVPLVASIAFIIGLFLHRRRQRRASPSKEAFEDPSAVSTSEILGVLKIGSLGSLGERKLNSPPAEFSSPTSYRAELSPTGYRLELDPTTCRLEMDGATPPSELDCVASQR